MEYWGQGSKEPLPYDCRRTERKQKVYRNPKAQTIPLPICDYTCSFILVVLLHILQLCGFFCKSSSGKDSFKFLTKYLATFSGEDSYTMSEAKEEAVRTIIEFVKAPDMIQVSY